MPSPGRSTSTPSISRRSGEGTFTRFSQGSPLESTSDSRRGERSGVSSGSRRPATKPAAGARLRRLADRLSHDARPGACQGVGTAAPDPGNSVSALSVSAREMISDVFAVMDEQEATVRADEKVGRHFRHLQVRPSPEPVKDRTNPVPVEARKHHGLEQPEPGRLDSESAVDLLSRIGDQGKRVAAPTRIPPNRRSGGVEEGDSRQAAGVQSRVLLCKVVQAQVAHRAGGVAKRTSAAAADRGSVRARQGDR